MKVKRTYGKRRTAANVGDSPRDDTFDRLLVDDEKPESPKLSVKQALRATFNRDSSLDESKVRRTAKPKRQQASKAKKKIKQALANSSHDELYESFLRAKKQKLSLKRKQRISVQNVQNSTPKGFLRKNKVTGLAFEVSSIRLDETMDSDDGYMDKKMIDNIRQQRLKEIENAKQAESSAIREANALLEGFEKIKGRREEPKDSSRQHEDSIKQMNIVETPKAQTKKPLTKRESLKEIPAVQNSMNELSLDSFDEGHSLNFKEKSIIKNSTRNTIPSIKITSPEIDEASEREYETDKENSLQSASQFFGPPSIDEEEEVELSAVTRKRKSLPKPVESTRKRTLIEEASTSVCDTAIASPVIQEIQKQIAKKSVKIINPPVPSNITRRSTRKTLINRGKTSIRFTELPEADRIVLQPGKSWRRSLINHRKTLHGNEQMSNRRTTVIIEEDEEASPVVKRYTEKLLETLGESVLLEQSDEGNLHAALSILDSSIKCAATFHDQRKTCQRQTSVFQRSSIFYGLQTPLIDVDAAPSLSARQIALRRCGQQDPLPFDELYSESQLPNCCKIGEGVYGEVFMYKCPNTHQPIVLKIIPIEGDLLINGEPQKRFDEILQEIVISMELSALRNGKDFSTDGFVNVQRVSCVQGAYPLHLIDEWELYRDNRVEGSDNDHPEVFPYDQLYVVFELCNGGRDLEAFVFNNAEEAQSVFLQTALTLAVAEQKFEFEHRDLHWGNILIAPTTEKFVEYRLKGEVVKLLTHGVKVTIIDYSLSRMVYDGAVLYDNLARDEELFQSQGDYQFDIYRLMRERVENQFERYEPYTNLLWLHYIVDKLINGARYRYSKTKKHRAAINEMMQERDELLNFKSASDYASTLDV